MKVNFGNCLGEIFLFNNGTIARVVEINYGRKSKYNPGNIKLRCIRRVVGTKRPYTYQRWCNLENLKGKKVIGTEQMLIALFFQYNNNIIKNLYR